MSALQKLAIVTDDPGWHGRMLTTAFAQWGIETEYLQLQKCEIDLSRPMGLKLGDFAGTPLAVFVRGIPGGTLEQVTTRLNILHTLRDSGIVVYNDARAIERTVDKGMTSVILARNNIPTPETWVTEDAASLEALCRHAWAHGDELVMKPLFGSQGEGLELLSPERPIPELTQFKGVAYLQRFVRDKDGLNRDYRVFVVGGKARAAMARHGIDWRNNVAQGGRCQAITPDPSLTALAEATVKALDMDYAGVDIIHTRDAGFQVIEVNSVPAWYGLQSVSSECIADCLAHDLVTRKLRHHPAGSQLRRQESQA